MEKLILTIDLDAFFASCEELRDPSLKQYPIVVGHEINGKGIVSTANYKAREYGIKSAMPLFKAKELYKDIKIVTPDFAYYQEMGNKVFGVISNYTETMEVASIDECFVDVTHLTKRYKPLEIASMIKNDVKKQTGLTVSIGISTNLLLSKMASGMDKPNGITTLWQHELPVKLWPLPIGELYMVGKQTSKMFIDNGINTIGDLAHIREDQEKYESMKKKVGISFDKLIAEANGVLLREVDTKGARLKSISKDETFGVSLTGLEQMREEAKKLTKFVFMRMEKRGLYGSTVHLGLKRHGSFNRLSSSKKIGTNMNTWDDIWATVDLLLDGLYREGMIIKQISVSVSGLKDSERIYKQLSIDEAVESSINDLQDFIDDISFETRTELVLGSTMIDNRHYEKRDKLDSDTVKFKSWSD